GRSSFQRHSISKFLSKTMPSAGLRRVTAQYSDGRGTLVTGKSMQNPAASMYLRASASVETRLGERISAPRLRCGFMPARKTYHMGHRQGLPTRRILRRSKRCDDID